MFVLKYCNVIVFIFILYSCSLVSGQGVPGVYLRTNNESVPDGQCNGLSGTQCDGCNHLLTCIGGIDTPISRQTCGTLNPTRPYCSNNRCSDTPAENCRNDGFLCTDEGYFPDPTNCSLYHICSGSNEGSEVYSCPPGYVYNSLTLNCRRRANVNDCPILDCRRTDNSFIIYPPNRAYYAYCSFSDGIRKTTVFRCRDTQLFGFDLASLSCEFRCPREGQFVDRFDCNKYYECYLVTGAVYNYIHHSCPPGYHFTNSTPACVRGPCNPEIV